MILIRKIKVHGKTTVLPCFFDLIYGCESDFLFAKCQPSSEQGECSEGDGRAAEGGITAPRFFIRIGGGVSACGGIVVVCGGCHLFAAKIAGVVLIRVGVLGERFVAEITEMVVVSINAG